MDNDMLGIYLLLAILWGALFYYIFVRFFKKPLMFILRPIIHWWRHQNLKIIILFLFLLLLIGMINLIHHW